ncbi:glycogen-binding subunit 76A isoform X1 [Danaus plexippus]|uniref:glycogen-binding subunit 76A isoform X1 n=2 Tax=Danaus plexippus TaxID=13037 RepID=UPI002AB3262E|nr:glycogen-binding subunit 76A isoform X1 [Danaus plexippus]
MNSPNLTMSLEHQMPVLMKKTQMSGDCAGSQCGLTSLLPMSCRGRAAAFARDLHSRLRNLGASHDGELENSWLARDSAHRPTNSNHSRDIDTFYDFELECESPSSPVDEYVQFPDKHNEDKDPPFYDVDSDPEHKEQTKSMLKQPDKGVNGFKFSTAFYTESPINFQPSSKENGHIDKPLYSPITFEGCARQNSFDEVDCAQPLRPYDTERLFSQFNSNDSDSEFESAKSDPSEGTDDVTQDDTLSQNNLVDATDAFSITDTENLQKGNVPEYSVEVSLAISECQTVDKTEAETILNNGLTETVTSEALNENDSLSVQENDSSSLDAESKSEDDGEDDRPQRVRRCSSLKTGKTPPGTPGRKKIVRFADVLGLDLADVKTFMDEIPVIPKSAYDDLTGCDVQNSPPTRPPPRLGALTLVPLFQVPRDVTEKLERQNVCLESSRVCDGVHVTICGSVRVRNLDFHKTVHIRYTMNRWKTYTDLQANYVQGSCDGYSDRFQFTLYAPCISSGQRLEIAVRFQCKGQQFWDNNSGANYCFDCLALGNIHATSSPMTLHPTVDWHPSFY